MSDSTDHAAFDEAAARRIFAEEFAKLFAEPKRLVPRCRREDFDHELFFEKLDHSRRLRNVDWKHIATTTGVSVTTLSRMKDGRRPDAASLAALSAWAGINPANCIRRATLSPDRPAEGTKP